MRWVLLVVIGFLVGLLLREVLRRRRTVDRGRAAAREIEALHDEAEERFAEREALAAAAPGGSPERPLIVTASSVVEARANNEPCLRCGGPIRVDEHTVEPHGELSLRVAHVRCPRCGYARRRWFLIRPETSELH